MNYRERPRCRKVIEGILRNGDVTLEDIAENRTRVRYSAGIRIQARKMMQEARRMQREKRAWVRK